MMRMKGDPMTTRRAFLQATAAGATAGLVAPRLLSAAEGGGGHGPPRPPNIVWISAEDISPTLGCYGDAYATTPHLDAFAAQGVRYDQAFTHAPVCAPARSGIITGMYPSTLGTSWMRCHGCPPPEAICFPEYLRAAGYFCTNRSKTDYQFPPPESAWDECDKDAHWRHRPDAAQPFFSVFNFTITHESLTRQWTPGKQDHAPAEAPVPPYYPDTPEVRQNIACYYDRMTELDRLAQGVLEALEADGLAENTIVWFWGDHGWGLTRGKRWVYDSGLRVPLMIRVPQRYRAWAGGGDASRVAPGSAESAFARFIDFAPTVLSLAGVPVPPHMQGRAFLGPQTGPEPAFIYAARDRMDETTDCIRSWQDKRYKLIRNFMPWLSRGQHINYMDRTPILQEIRRLDAAGDLEGPQRQYMEPTKPVREFYDLEADPHEIHNLADDPAHTERIARMEIGLFEHLKRIGDVGLMPEAEFDALKGGGRTTPPCVSAAANDPGRVTLACATRGASIVYRPKTGKGRGKGRWRLYHEPLTLGADETVEAMAVRLGYADSATVTFSRDNLPPDPEPLPDPSATWRQDLDASGTIERLLALKAWDGRWREAVDTYLAALKDPSGPVRYWAVVGLHRAFAEGDPPDAVREALAACLDDPAVSVPVAAAEAMVVWGEAERGLEVLVAWLDHDLEKAQYLAAVALEALGEKARPALPRMKAALGGLARYPQDMLERAVKNLEGKGA